MRFALSILLILASMPVLAQLKVSGYIRDAQSNDYLSGVMVSACKEDKVLAYTFSNNGKYELNIKGEDIEVVFYLMGYKKIIKNLVDAENNYISLDINLESSDIGLPEIVVKPITINIKKDTVTYDASRFVRPEDGSLQEVLNRLPHVQVTSMGTVKVQGVNVNKVYIEDMDLFGGRYGIAIKNLSPEDIASVSVYYNHQPKKILDGRESTGQAAINIKLKEKVKNRWNFNGGGYIGGESFIYGGKLSSMIFNSKRQSVILAKTDNSGEDIITETKLQNLKPGGYLLDDLQGNILDHFRIGIHSLPIPLNHYLRNNSNLLSANNIVKLPNGSHLKFNVVGSTNNIQENEVSRTTITPYNNNNQIHIIDSTSRNRLDKRIEGDITYTKNNDKIYIENLLSFKLMADKAIAYLTNNSSEYSHAYSLPKIQINNKLEVIRRNNDKIKRILADCNFSHIDQNMAVKQTNKSNLFDTNYIVQHIYTNYLTSNISTSYQFNIGKGYFSLIPGAKLWYKSYETRTSPEIGSMHNDINLFSLQPYIDGKIEITGKRFKMKLHTPISLRSDFNSNKQNFHFLYSPLIDCEYALTQSVKVKGYANLYNSVGDINEMGNGFIYTSYRNLYSYEIPSQQINHRYNLSGTFDSFSKLIFLKIYANYSIINSNLLPDELYLDNYTFITYKEEDNIHRLFNTGVSIKKIFGNLLTAGLIVDLSKNSQTQYLQGERYNYKNNGIGISLNCELTPCNDVSIRYNGDYRRVVQNNGNTIALKSFNNKITANWKLIDRLLIKGEFAHVLQHTAQSKPASLSFLDFEIKYDISPKVHIYTKLKNLLNNKEYIYTRLNSAQMITQSIQLRGCEFLAGISFKL